jgi:hypothetical protein
MFLLNSRCVVGAFAFALATSLCVAQDTETRRAPGGSWVLGLAGQLDEESNDSVLASVNWAVTPSTWLTFAAGRSSSPADRAAVQADTIIAGVDHRFGLVGLGLEVERWGDSAALETADLRGSVYVERERFRVGVTHETRDIDIPFTLTGPLGGMLQRTATLGADNTRVDVRVSPAARWQLYMSATEHSYERDLSLLPRIDRLNWLSASTLTLANIFIDHERTIGVEREVGRTLLNVSFGRDRSAIDGSKFETLDAAVLFPVGARMDLEVNIGRGRSELLDAGVYGGALLLIYGR